MSYATQQEGWLWFLKQCTQNKKVWMGGRERGWRGEGAKGRGGPCFHKAQGHVPISTCLRLHVTVLNDYPSLQHWQSLYTIVLPGESASLDYCTGNTILIIWLKSIAGEVCSNHLNVGNEVSWHISGFLFKTQNSWRDHGCVFWYHRILDLAGMGEKSQRSSSIILT